MRGQSGRIGLGVVVALAAAGLAGCSGPGASSTTVVRGARQATVTHANGHTETARDGMALRPGDVVRTDPGGSATLVTAGRRVRVGGDGAIAVDDGLRQQLRHGWALVDARRGPALALRAGVVTVRMPQGAVTRVTRSFTVAVGVLAGRATLGNDSGLAVEVPALRQTTASGAAVSGRMQPLQLHDDAAELATGLQVVADDVRIGRLADGLDSTPQGHRAATVALQRHQGDALPAQCRPVATAAPSAWLLPLAIGRAAGGGPGPLRQAACLRAQGGSWGVVAHLQGTDATAVGSALSDLEDAVLLAAATRGKEAPASAAAASGPAARPAVPAAPTDAAGAVTAAGPPEPAAPPGPAAPAPATPAGPAGPASSRGGAPATGASPGTTSPAPPAAPQPSASPPGPSQSQLLSSVVDTVTSQLQNVPAPSLRLPRLHLLG